MSEVTFTPEQVKEIRQRLEGVEWPSFTAPERRAVLAAFPLPKVTRYRTFEHGTDTYRVNGGTVEYLSKQTHTWHPTNYGTGSVAAFAQGVVGKRDWTALAALADVAARPTEEVDP